MKKLSKSDVYDHMADNELDSARFVLTKEGKESKTVVEVYHSDHFADYMVVEIWHGERLGNSCYLSGYRSHTFELADDNASSEQFPE